MAALTWIFYVETATSLTFPWLRARNSVWISAVRDDFNAVVGREQEAFSSSVVPVEQNAPVRSRSDAQVSKKCKLRKRTCFSWQTSGLGTKPIASAGSEVEAKRIPRYFLRRQ